ncbi:glycosyltransferase family 4 protein [Candidatus Pelagibacter sp. Uisw_094]|uniref:glycosyltransferase family 4 protein n=1 Tax=Candidatus Pelagibacter sp. Uisw_094 TaxID=3230980 RepID=UPI0039EAC7E8
MKISILLPYKENFSPNYAGSISLFISQTVKKSKYLKSIKIFGSTDYKKILLNNYINIKLNSKFYESTSKRFIKNFILKDKKNQSDLLEIHNRPHYIRLLSKYYKNKIILYFHNNPLEMKGSKSLKERIYLLENVDKIVFNSKWSKQKFFTNISNKKYIKNISICYQSSDKPKINFIQKKKIISFVGKLNKSKGYDLFGKAIIQILDKHKEWKGVVFGDEPREDLFFDHSRLKIMGFKDNNFILNYLKKVSISVVCSRWNEPFGRSSLEASSRGSAVIISNKGGLPETCKSAIKLKVLSVKCIYNEIDKLIQNKKNLLKIQKENYTNFNYTHSYISKVIDSIRGSVLK